MEDNKLLILARDKFKGFDIEKQDQLSFKTELDDMQFSSYLFVKKNTNRLYVMLSGALTSDRKTSFTYHRWSWHEKFNGSVLYIADPVLSNNLDLNIGWYIGKDDVPVDKYIAEFVKFIAKKLNIALDHIIAYGSSAGGYAAIQLASNIQNGMLAVAINPQTNVFKYLEEPVKALLDKCWIKTAPKYNNSRFNILYKDVSKTKILYIQNKQDVDHYNDHMHPFFDKLAITGDSSQLPVNKQKGPVRTIIYDHPSGHAAEPNEMLPEIFDSIDYMIQNVGWSNKNFFILGSCISRDVFLPSYREDIGSTGYYPRTSFARLALEPVESIPDLNQLSSPFQRKIVKQDMKLDVLHALATTSFDYILIDLIDERYGLVKYGNTFITNSYEVNVSGILGNVSQLEKIEAGSDEFYSLWEKGFKVFVDYCEENNLLDKVIVNKVYWASMLDDASPIPNLDKEKIIINNSVLDKLYNIMQKYISESNFIVYPKSYFVAKKDHKWGVMPFHYVDSFYKHTYEELNNLK